MENNLLEIAIKAAINAGEEILEIYREDDFGTEWKADATPITRADKAAHLSIVRRLQPTQIPIVSEEGVHQNYEERKQWQQLWMVDPLDGTKEFIKRNGEFTVNIALIEKGKAVLGVIYVPVTGELYFGGASEGAFKAKVKNTRVVEKQPLPLVESEGEEKIIVASRSFKDADTEQFIATIVEKTQTVSRGSSLKFCMIAEGKADIYPRFVHLKEWDIAAGVAIVKAAGGSVTEADTRQEIAFNTQRLEAPCFIAKRN